MNFKTLLLGGVAAFAFAAPSLAQDFPNQTIRMVVPFAAGGQTDIMGRLIADQMGKELGQQIIVENIGGAGGTIGAANIAQSDADGYSLLFGTVGTQVVNQFTMPDLPYDTATAFSPIILASSATAVIVAHPDFEASTMAELIALAKEKPGEIQYTTPGVGTSGHLAMELVEYMAGIDLVAVPYQGGAPATTDLIAGHMQLGVDGLPGQLAQINSGALKALGTSGRERDPVAPEVPAIAETVEGLEATAWYAIVAPAGVPEDVVAKLNAAANAALANEELSTKLREMGISTGGGSAQDLANFISQETVKWQAVVEAAGISAD